MRPANLNIHPSCPKRLVTALRKAKWNFNQLERDLHVNRGVLYKLIVYGIEPAGAALRQKVFLPKHLHKTKAAPTKPREPLPAYMLWWRKLPAAERQKLIVELYGTERKREPHTDPV